MTLVCCVTSHCLVLLRLDDCSLILLLSVVNPVRQCKPISMLLRIIYSRRTNVDGHIPTRQGEDDCYHFCLENAGEDGVTLLTCVDIESLLI